MTKTEINNMCYDVIKLHRERTANNEFITKLNKLLHVVNYDLIKSLNKNYSGYYFIYLFCVIFKEYLITKDDVLNIVKSDDNVDYYSILCMSKELDDEIVLNMLSNIKKGHSNLYLGAFPYDYRFHILIRKEISYKIKKEILDQYSKEELITLYEEIKKDIANIKYYSEVECDMNVLNSDYYLDRVSTYEYLSLRLNRKNAHERI